MSMMLWLLPLVGIGSFVLTALLRRYALARSVLDIPNARSSHSVPTPRGGGVAIVLSFMLGLVIVAWAGVIDPRPFGGLSVAGLGVAVLGFLDDHGHVAARWRLLGHFLASSWMLLLIGGLPPVELLGHVFDLGWLGHVLAVFYLVWLLNLYNFMDGIDGIASIEAICVCVGGAVLYSLAGKSSAFLPLVLAAAVAGFLLWNFPPAKIFMGDAGSGFLGVMLGGLSLQAAWDAPSLFWGWLILLGVFVVDATFTLLRRLLRRERVYEAHRSHAYQYAARRAGKHLPVTLAVLALNVCWLLPVAALVVLGWLEGLFGLFLAYAPLMLLAIAFKAGQRELPTEVKGQ